MPFIVGSTTARTAAAVIAASMALPPSCSTLRPAADASGWLVAIMPLVPSTMDRVARGLAAGRSPGPWPSTSTTAVAVATATSAKTVGFISERLLVRKAANDGMVRDVAFVDKVASFIYNRLL